jgi:hypothetical protein
MMRLFALIAGVFVAAILAGVASGHTRTESGTWYFDGMTYDTGDRTKRMDPVNFMFAPGPADNSLYDRDRIEQHMNDDWNHKAVGGSGWRTDFGVRPWCKQDQLMFWENVTERTSDKTDWHGTTARFGGICGKQHHARFWDDQEHARQTGTHGSEDQWAVGGIHHERTIRKKPCCVGHRPDRDWDVVRRELVRAMAAHCSEVAWRYHPDADGVIQGYMNYGFIARISLRHVASGPCDGF